MLILTRKIQEAIIINDNVTITVLSVNGGQVRIGIDAPRDVPVHREEIYHQIKKEGHKSKSESKHKAEAKPEAKILPVKDKLEYSQPDEIGEGLKNQPVILKKKRRVITKDEDE